MPLPADWQHVDWRPSVIILPDHTDGVRTLPLNRDKFPQFPRGYYMMATTDSHGPLVFYNAADIGDGGDLASQFVFWHEMGHFYLGHVTGKPLALVSGVPVPGPVALGSSKTGNKETDCDHFAFQYWIRNKDAHGVRVLHAAVKYFEKLGDAPGDHEHPAPKARKQLLLQHLNATHGQIVIYNDHETSGDFVLHALTSRLGLTADEARVFLQNCERNGHQALTWFRASGQQHQIGVVDGCNLIDQIQNDARQAHFNKFRIDYQIL